MALPGMKPAYVTRYQHNMHMFHTFIRKEWDGSGRYIVVKKAIHGQMEVKCILLARQPD